MNIILQRLVEAVFIMWSYNGSDKRMVLLNVAREQSIVLILLVHVVLQASRPPRVVMHLELKISPYQDCLLWCLKMQSPYQHSSVVDIPQRIAHTENDA